MTDMTVAQVAEACGVTERTVRRWLREGRLQALRVGGRIRIPTHALREVSAPYGSDAGEAVASPILEGARLAVGASLEEEARTQRVARAERLLASVRAMADGGIEDAVALVRAGRDDQDARWDGP